MGPKRKRRGRKMPKNVLAYFKALKRAKDMGPVDSRERAAIRKYHGV